MKLKLRSLTSLLLVLLLLMAVSGCASIEQGLFPERAQIAKERQIRELKKQDVVMEKKEAPAPLIDPSIKPQLRKDQATLAVVGDVLIHLPLINGALQPDGSYDFAYSYRYIESEIQAADYAAFNMEGTLAGEPYEGYPIFSAPDILAPTLKDAGFDLAYAANNHCLDRGIEGLKQTAKKLTDAGLDLVGTRAEAEAKGYLIKQVNKLKLAFFNYTYETDRIDGLRSLNGITMAEEDEAYVDSFSIQEQPEDLLASDLEKMTARIEQIKAEKPDFIIALLHWGDEYATTSNPVQKRIAQHLAGQGVDLIVGAGPHVAQEITWLDRPDGGQTLCYYSVGNFISNQQFDTADNGGYAEDGLIALIKFERGIKGPAKIAKAGYMPTYCFKLHPQEDHTYATILPVIPALADLDKYKFDGGSELLEQSLERTRKVMGQNSIGVREFANLADFRAD